MKIDRLIPPPLGVPIGYLPGGKPVYPVFGGSEDLDIDPDEEETEDDPDESEEEPDEEGQPRKKGKYTPPEQAEWLKVQTALNKSNASAKQRRLDLAEAQKKIASLEAAAAKREADDERRRLVEERLAAVEGTESKGKKRQAGRGGVPAAVVDLPDGVLTKTQVAQQVKAAEKAAADAAAEKFRGMVVGSAARAALISEGVPKESVNRLTKLLDLDEIEVDDDGQVTGGLDEQLAALKEELPQLFKAAEQEPPKPRRRPAPKITQAEQPAAETRPLSSAERMAAGILGSR